MNDDNDRISRVANDGASTIMVVAGALAAVLIFGILVSQGQVSSQELDRLGPFAIALAVGAGVLILAYVVRVILAIWPRQNDADRAITRRQHDLEAEVSKHVAVTGQSER